MLAGLENGVALHTVGESDEMAADSDQINHDESELLQAESLVARELDRDFAAGLRHHGPGSENQCGRLLARAQRPLSAPG